MLRITLKTCFAFLSLIFVIACTNDIDYPKPINYDFKIPHNLPFEVDSIVSEIDILDPDTLHQFIYFFKNEKNEQLIKYVVSKAMDQELVLEIDDKFELKLANGKPAYYKEDGFSQQIWWEHENGFIGRMIYFYRNRDSENEKLDRDTLVDLANQVQ